MAAHRSRFSLKSASPRDPVSALTQAMTPIGPSARPGAAFPRLGGGSEESARVMPQGVVLVAREDIVVTQGGRALLLARAGAIVDEETLPKLIRYGVDPAQFSLEENAESVASREPSSSAMSAPVASRRPRDWQAILAVEPDDRAAHRLNDALTMCGVRHKDIHVVRATAHVAAALDAFRPAILLVSDAAHPASSIVAYLRRLRESAALERVAVISALPRTQEAARRKLQEMAAESGVETLFRPLTPFALSALLAEYRARLTLLRQRP